MLGMAVAVGLGIPAAPVEYGLYGYNAVLAVLCVGGIFLRPSLAGAMLTLLAGTMATVLNAALAALWTPVGLPTLTFPAAATCVTFMLFATRAWPKQVVPLEALGVPEMYAVLPVGGPGRARRPHGRRASRLPRSTRRPAKPWRVQVEETPV